MSSQNNKITNAEYTHALTEAQTRLEALTTSFALFIGEHVDPDILGLQCIIDDADRLSGTVRHIRHLTQNGKITQQPELGQSVINQTDQAVDPCGFDPDYSHHDICSESLNRNGFMVGGIINLNRRAWLVEGDSELYRDNAYYSLMAARMLFEDSQALTRAWIDAVGKSGQGHSQADSGSVSPYPTTIDANILASIEQITSQAINVLSSFTDVLAGKDPISAVQVMEWFDFITSAIKRIDAVMDGSGNALETQQA